MESTRTHKGLGSVEIFSASFSFLAPIKDICMLHATYTLFFTRIAMALTFKGLGFWQYKQTD